MGQTVTLHLSDETFEVIRNHAKCEGKPLDIWITSTLEQQMKDSHSVLKSKEIITEAQMQEARERFELHFGEVDLGCPTGTNNDRIDADLAYAYTRAHDIVPLRSINQNWNCAKTGID